MKWEIVLILILGAVGVWYFFLRRSPGEEVREEGTRYYPPVPSIPLQRR